MKVYDCFTFYNEFELLELRLKSLWDVVDCFVIVEADKTHSNKPKPYYFWERQDEFKNFFAKIRHLPVEMTVPYSGAGDWSIENAQRDAIIYGLGDAAPDDLIFISDIDEIPAPDVLQRLAANEITLLAEYKLSGLREETLTCPSRLLTSAKNFLEHCPIVMAQNFHCYYFDWISSATWQGSILTKRKNLSTPQKLRDLRNDLPRVSDGGWHFSSMGGVDRVINKMTSIVDGNALVEISGGRFIDRAHVEKTLADGTDLYARQNFSEAQLLPYDAKKIRLPHLREFLTKYPQFLREPKKFFANELP